MAKARRRPVKNPSIPRLEWVAKTYPDWVWYYTVRAFFLATGMDTDAGDLAMGAAEVQHSNGYLAAQGHEVPTFPESLSEEIEKEIDFAGLRNTEYDKYLPWLAKNLNAYGKGPSKRVRKLVGARYPDMILPEEPGTDAASKITIGPFRFSQDSAVVNAVGSLEWDDQVEARTLMNSWYEDVDGLAHAFGSIVHWVLEAGVNLDDYSGKEARMEAMQWADSRPKGDIVRGDVVYEFGDGWTFQELKTRRQLECEGTVQDHCVKHYSAGKIGKKYRIFSLRDPDGQPHVTMEWNVPKEFVYQYKGLSNRSPERDEVERAVEFRLNYIDKNLVSEDNELEQIVHQSELFPMHAGEFKGEFKGAFMPPGRPELAFANYEGGHRESAVSVWAINEFVSDAESFASNKYGAGDSEAVGEYVLDLVRKTEPGNIPGSDIPENDFNTALMWGVWLKTGEILASDDELLEQIGYHDLQPPKDAAKNPRKRKAAKKTAKKPHWKLLLDISRKLFEDYDAKPIKRNLVAFGVHSTTMKEAGSAKVRGEGARAHRAYKREMKAHGWKEPKITPRTREQFQDDVLTAKPKRGGKVIKIDENLSYHIKEFGKGAWKVDVKEGDEWYAVAGPGGSSGWAKTKAAAEKLAVRDVLAKSSVPWEWVSEKPGRILASKGKRTVELRKWFKGSWDKGWVVSVIENGEVQDEYRQADGIMAAIKEGEKAFKARAKRKTTKKKARRKNPPAGSPLRLERDGRGSRWPDRRTVAFVLGTRDERKAFTKVAKEMVRLGFAIDYEYVGKHVAEGLEARGLLVIQSETMPLPLERMSEIWDSASSGHWMQKYDDDYKGPEDQNSAAEELLVMHGGTIPLSYGDVRFINPKKRKAAKKKAGNLTKKKQGISKSLKVSSTPWIFDEGDLSFGGKFYAKRGPLVVVLRQWSEDKWDKGWTVHATKGSLTLEDREEELDIKEAIKHGETHFKAKKKAAKKKARRKNPPAGSPLRREFDRQKEAGEHASLGPWPQMREVTFTLGTRDHRKAFTKMAKEMMRLGFAIDYNYIAEGYYGGDSQARGELYLQSESMPLPWDRMEEAWYSLFVDSDIQPRMYVIDDEYKGPEDPEDQNAAAEALLEKHGGKIPLTYGSVEIVNPKKR